MSSIIKLDSVIVATNNQISADLAGEAVILHLGQGIYYSLDTVGARIWSLIQTPVTIDKIRDVILEEYEVSREQCESDLLALLLEMKDKQLVEVRNETN